MPDITKVLREEISRLARKEVKQATEPLRKQIRELGEILRAQRQRISEMETLTKRMNRGTAPQVSGKVSENEEAKIRIPKGSVRNHRSRLGLSQREMGLLLGVSALTVSNWETGKMSPRGQNQQAFAEVRNIGAREAKQRLGKMATG